MRSTTRLLGMLGLLALGTAMVTSCGGENSDETGDRAALVELEQRQADAWANGDGAAYAATFAEDADFVDVMGGHVHGRAAIEKSMQEGFDTFMAGTRVSDAKERIIRFVSPEVAVVVTKGVCVLRGTDQCREEDLSIQTRVAVKREGSWLFTTFQNNRMRSAGPPG